MAPKSCPEAGEAKEEALPSPVDGEPVSGHLEPPADTSADLVAPASRKDTMPSSTQVASSAKLPLAPESLDPHTLRLLWRQRELEIQALRCLQSQQDARRAHILREVARLPQESSHNQEKHLRIQVQKLALELKEQKEQAQLERKQLEKQLEQTKSEVLQLDAQLQALHRSCLVKLASSSWVGRVLKSSTGSVEVVTAETLLDLSDDSENDEASPDHEGFRMEDVDWNAIAHRYPNLLANLRSSSDFKRTSHRQTPQLPAASPPEEHGSRLGKLPKEADRKSVEWRSLPVVGTSSSRGSDSDSSGRGVHKVTGHPPQAPGHISYELIQAWPRSPIRSLQDFRTRSFIREVQDSRPRSSIRSSTKDSRAESEDRLGPVRKARAVSDHWSLTHPWSRKGSCLKIVAVNLRERFIRILNQSMEETVDLGGFTLQQLEQDFPVYLYRFPPRTLLAPQHHVTVWGKGSGSTKKQPPSSVGRGPRHLRSGRSFVTLLLSPKGEVLSEYRAPHSVTPAPRTFEDNTNVSIDRFPLPEAQPGADSHEQGRPTRTPRNHRVPKARARSRRRPRTRALLPRLTPSKLFSPGEVPAPPERAETDARKPLPAISQDRPDLADYQAGKEHRVRVCRKSVDRDCPIVALSVQSMTEKRFGFRLLSCPPVPVNACLPV